VPDALAEALLRPMLDPAAAAAQRAGFAEALAKLRAPAGLPSEAAAEAVLGILAPSTGG
jgi:lipid-A-disaccharide synthase